MSRHSREGAGRWLGRRALSCCLTFLVVAAGTTLSQLPGRDARVAQSTTTAFSHPSTLTVCRSELAGAVKASARPDYGLDNFMRSYANSIRGWTGGDGGDSVPLASGQDIWLFDDSYLGTVIGDRRVGSPLLRNVIVWQRGKELFTHYGSAGGKPTELMNYRVPPRGLYWANDGVALGDHLFVSYWEVRYPKVAQVLNFVKLRTVLAEFSLPKLHLEAVRTLTKGAGTDFGSAMVRQGGYVYLYGLKQMAPSVYPSDSLYLARLPVADMSAPLERFDGEGWSTSEAATPLLGGLSTAVGVAHFGDMYVLVSMYPSMASTEIVAYFSCTLTGPFVDRTVVYKTIGANDASAPYQTSGIRGVYTYGAAVHPEISTGDQLVLSFDVNTSDWSLLQKNVNIVRPRYLFLTIDPG